MPNTLIGTPVLEAEPVRRRPGAERGADPPPVRPAVEPRHRGAFSRRLLRTTGELAWHVSDEAPDRAERRAARGACGATIAVEAWQEADPEFVRPRDRCPACAAVESVGAWTSVPMAAREAV